MSDDKERELEQQRQEIERRERVQQQERQRSKIERKEYHESYQPTTNELDDDNPPDNE